MEGVGVREILIIGGGAAGLMAAVCAKERDASARVTVLEAGERVGKKLLSTGNGRCNLTNVGARAEDYAPADVRGVLEQEPPRRVMERFERMGLTFRQEGEGRVYPASDAASSVLDTLRLTAAHLGVAEVVGFCAEQVMRGRKGFTVRAQDGRSMRGDRVILTCGGQAASKFTGYDLAGALGHTVTALRPGLLPVKTDGAGIRGLNGVRCRCAAVLLRDGKAVRREEGEVLFKDFGLSGIAVFQLTREMARGRGNYEIELDLLPQMEDAQAEEFVLRRAEALGWRGTDAFLLGMFHKNVAANLLKLAGIGPGCVGEVPAAQLRKLARLMKHWRHAVTGVQGFQSAQVTVGGVPLGEVEGRTLESRVCPGLYLAGEVLDVDGPCGGYNLQWAWASGAVAGSNAAAD